jgi:hypothetical protein
MSLTIPNIQIVLRVIGTLLAVPPFVHTEYNRYRLTHIKAVAGADSDDQVAKQLIKRRNEEGSKYKSWKVVCILLGVVLNLASFLLPVLFP